MNFLYKQIDSNMVDEIVELYIESFNSPPWNDNWTSETAYKRLFPLIGADRFWGLCAHKEGKMCGFIMGVFEQYCDDTEFAIKEFSVKNTGRGQGIGSKLFLELETRLRNIGVSRITLLTLRGNLTEHFYEKNGFRTDSKIICMNKIL